MSFAELSRTEIVAKCSVAHGRTKELTWLHFPKAGSSFANTIFHYACPFAPSNATVGDNVAPVWPPAGLAEHFNASNCGTLGLKAIHASPHGPVHYPQDAGRIVVIFRRPENRLTSCLNMLQFILNEVVQFRLRIGYELGRDTTVQKYYESVSAANVFRADGRSLAPANRSAAAQAFPAYMEEVPVGCALDVESQAYKDLDWHRAAVGAANGSFSDFQQGLSSVFWTHGWADGGRELTRQFWLASCSMPLDFLRAQRSTIFGVQAKLLLGHQAHESIHSTPFRKTWGEFEGSKTHLRLPSVAFVGLLEHWEASVCLFHRTFGGSVLPQELANNRDHVAHFSNGGSDNSHNAVRAFVESDIMRDQTDDYLYRVAVGRFRLDMHSAFGSGKQDLAKSVSETMHALKTHAFNDAVPPDPEQKHTSGGRSHTLDELLDQFNMSDTLELPGVPTTRPISTAAERREAA